MPPWENVLASERVCVQCGATFTAKRDTAKYCSERCQNRARGSRAYDPVKHGQWRKERLKDPEYRQRVNAQANARAIALRRWLDEYKVSVGCIDCGYSESPIPLDFDHVGDLKNRNVSACKSIAQAKAEIALCEVRCSNCHRLKTHERRHQSSTGS